MAEDFEPNIIYEDEFGRKSGLLLVDKPKGKTSHDMVYIARKKYEMKKIGHAGALDPFAEGLMMLMLGKATKLSNSFLNLDKTYEADVLFGIETDSGDPEGEILETLQDKIPVDQLQRQVETALSSFEPRYNQFVPVYSSVKVDGDKLRIIARKFDSFKVVKHDGKRIAQFFNEGGELKKEIELPKKEVQIFDSNVLHIESLTFEEVARKFELARDFEKKVQNVGLEKNFQFLVVKIAVGCSKGTYIRQLAIDLGEKVKIPGMLVGLKRTSVGNYTLGNAIDLE